MRNSLHWLNFPEQVTYKLCLLTYKCLLGLAPDYLTRLCVHVATVHGRPRLRSSDDHQLLIHGHIQLLLVRAPSTPLDQHLGTLYPLRFVIRQSHWEPLGRCCNRFCSD